MAVEYVLQRDESAGPLGTPEFKASGNLDMSAKGSKNDSIRVTFRPEFENCFPESRTGTLLGNRPEVRMTYSFAYHFSVLLPEISES